MKRLIYIFLSACFLLGCSGQTAAHLEPSLILQVKTQSPLPSLDTTFTPPGTTLSPTQTRELSITFTPSPTSWPTPTPELSPTYFFENYPFKQVWIKYGAGGSCCSLMGNFDDIFNFPISTFVIYTDNEIIISHQGSPILEKKLSNAEVCLLLNSLTYLGLDKYNGLGDNPDDAIYTANAKDNWSSDGVYYRLTVNGENPRFIHIYDTVRKFIIQPVITLRNYLEKYEPVGLKPY